MFTLSQMIADGIPMGLIFGIIVVVFWAVGAIVNSGAKKPPGLAQPSPEQRELAAIRRRMLEEHARQKREVLAGPKAKQKKKRRPSPPPIPQALAPAVTNVRNTLQQAVERAATPDRLGAQSADPIAAPTSRVRTSETARNVRLLLQRNALAEAFVLGEVLGTPRGLDGRQ